MNNQKVEELINVIDPNKTQCKKCKKWTTEDNMEALLCDDCFHGLVRNPTLEKAAIKFRKK